MAQNYHIASTLGSLSDLQKNNLWVVNFGDLNDVPDLKSLTVRAQTAKIPGRTIPAIHTKFMGMQANYAATEDMGNKTLDITFDEHDDQKIYTVLNEWLNLMFNSLENTNKGGHGFAASKLGTRDGNSFKYATDIKLGMTDLASNPLSKAIVFHNAFITSLNDASLGYDGSAKVSYNATFQYDWFEIVNANESYITVPKE